MSKAHTFQIHNTILYKSKNQSVVIRFEKDENEMYAIIGDSSNSEKLLKAFLNRLNQI